MNLPPRLRPALLLLAAALSPLASPAAPQVEALGRGLAAVTQADGRVFLT